MDTHESQMLGVKHTSGHSYLGVMIWTSPQLSKTVSEMGPVPVVDELVRLSMRFTGNN